MRPKMNLSIPVTTTVAAILCAYLFPTSGNSFKAYIGTFVAIGLAIVSGLFFASWTWPYPKWHQGQPPFLNIIVDPVEVHRRQRFILRTIGVAMLVLIPGAAYDIVNRTHNGSTLILVMLLPLALFGAWSDANDRIRFYIEADQKMLYLEPTIKVDPATEIVSRDVQETSAAVEQEILDMRAKILVEEENRRALEDEQLLQRLTDSTPIRRFNGVLSDAFNHYQSAARAESNVENLVEWMRQEVTAKNWLLVRVLTSKYDALAPDAWEYLLGLGWAEWTLHLGLDKYESLRDWLKTSGPLAEGEPHPTLFISQATPHQLECKTWMKTVEYVRLDNSRSRSSRGQISGSVESPDDRSVFPTFNADDVFSRHPLSSHADTLTARKSDLNAVLISHRHQMLKTTTRIEAAKEMRRLLDSQRPPSPRSANSTKEMDSRIELERQYRRASRALDAEIAQLEQTLKELHRADLSCTTELRAIDEERETLHSSRTANALAAAFRTLTNMQVCLFLEAKQAYLRWHDLWLQAQQGGVAILDNDDAYIATVAPTRAAQIQPPLVPLRDEQGALIVSEHVWWRHHVLYTRANKPEHLFMGCLLDEPSRSPEHLHRYEPLRPFYLHRPLLENHCYVAGRTGAGKTSLFVLPTILQLIEGWGTAVDSSSEPVPLVIIDLAGDEVLFYETKKAAEARGQVFRFFTSEKGQASFRFNPFSGFDMSRHAPPEVAQMFLDALALNHGPGYGRDYFSKIAQDLFTETLHRHPAVRSFSQLSAAIERTQQEVDRFKRNKGDAGQLIATTNTLVHYPQLTTMPGEDTASDVIYFPRVLEDREIVYFWLPAPLASISVREIAGLALLNLRAAAVDRQRQRPADPRQTYLFIDEFQRIINESFPNLLQQARHQGIAAILANQSFDELKLASGLDLRPGVRDNTRVKVFFDVPDNRVFRLFNASASGETPAAIPFPSTNSFDASHLYTEGRTHGTTEAESSATGWSHSVADSSSETRGHSTTTSRGRFRGEGSGNAQTRGGSEGRSDSTSYSSKYEDDDDYLIKGTTTRSSSETWSDTESRSSSTGESETSGKSNSWATTDGTTETRGTTGSEGRSRASSEARATQWATYGKRYSGFTIGTTWHIPKAEKEKVEQLGWPNWDAVPRPAPQPKLQPEAEVVKREADPVNTEQQLKMQLAFEQPRKATPPKQKNKPPKRRDP